MYEVAYILDWQKPLPGVHDGTIAAPLSLLALSAGVIPESLFWMQQKSFSGKN